MIYILEDDASIRKLVVYTIQSQGMEAEGFARPSQFWEALAQKTPELVLLDIMLPEEDGLQVLKRLRSLPAPKGGPLIMPPPHSPAPLGPTPGPPTPPGHPTRAPPPGPEPRCKLFSAPGSSWDRPLPGRGP